MIFKLRRGTIDLGHVVIQMLMSSGRRGQPAARLNIWTGAPQGRGWCTQNGAAFVRPAAAPHSRVGSTDCLINSGKNSCGEAQQSVLQPGAQFQRTRPELRVKLLLEAALSEETLLLLLLHPLGFISCIHLSKQQVALFFLVSCRDFNGKSVHFCVRRVHVHFQVHHLQKLQPPCLLLWFSGATLTFDPPDEIVNQFLVV